MSGRAKASPTTCMVSTFSASTARHTEAGSRRRVSSGMTTVPPPVKQVNVDHWAAPCMRGGVAITLSPPRPAFSTISS